MTIDLHCHYVPQALADSLRVRRDPPWIERQEGGGEILHLPVGRLAFHDGYTDMAARLAFMDRLGIDRQVLSFPGLFGLDSLPVAECGEMLAAWNDDVAALCARHPDRFAGIAALPLADMEAAAREYRRARTGLGLSGVILPVNGFVSVAEAERFRPLLDTVNRLGGHVFIHPGRRPDQAPPPGSRAPEYPFPDNVLARQALAVQHDVASAMVTLLLSGFLDPWPMMPVQMANLGGTLPMVIERIDHAVALRDPGTSPPSARMRRVHVDCSSLGPHAIEIAVATFGADRILFGTDCPIFSTERTLAAVAGARIGDKARRALLSGNAGALLARVRV
jgi:predicted TIM-barrel fold metal-dependent hydrolase